MMRLQKFLSTAGVCSRRQGEENIKDGRVKVNGKVVTILGTKVEPETDLVEFDGKPVKIKQDPVYPLLQKSPSNLCAILRLAFIFKISSSKIFLLKRNCCMFFACDISHSCKSEI